MIKFNIILKNALFTSVLLLMTNCATEEIGQKNVTQSSTEAKIWFSANKKNYNTTILEYANDFEWQNAIISNGDIGEVIEVPFTLTNKLSVTNKERTLYNDHHRLMFIKDKNNEFKLFDVQIFTDDEKFKIEDKNFNYYSIKDDFNGKIFLQELATNIGRKLEFKHGNKIIPSLTSKQPEQAIECVWIGYWYEDGHFEPIKMLYCDGMGDNEPTPIGGYGGGGGSSGSSSGNNSALTFQKIQKNINSDKLDPCTKAVLEKLKNAKQDNIAIMLARFNPSGSLFNLNMMTGQVPNNNPNIWAQTIPVAGSNTDIIMTFNQDYINGKNNSSPPTDLSVATTMAHEIIHAYLISQIQEFKSCGAPGVICDFPTVYDAYVDLLIKKDVNNTYTQDKHHELIANSYVFAIALAIQEFHTGEINTSGYPNQVYLDLAWGGLTDTDYFKRTYPDDPSNKNYQDRVRIFGRINAEKIGSVYGINTPIGTPCKK